jgi:glycerophosphoryl diester phosphodiesterase
MWFDLPVPAIIAHRGDSVHAPENTLAAFNLAVQHEEAVEFDVKLTIDGQVVVLHDQTVDRTTDGSGRVTQMRLAELKELDAGSWFSDQFRGEHIPTLDEVFTDLGEQLYMNIELANYITPFDTLVSRVVELVKKHHLESRILFSSFFARNLNQAQTLLPEVPCGLLTLRGWMGMWGRTFGWRGNYQTFHPYFTDVHSGMINRVHAQGRRLNVWTVNGEADMRRMLGMGVDGLITDDPTTARRLLGNIQ